MSGVKNLRAMFENKGDDSSPPDRGRSPSGLSSGARSSDSPRPLSSVRSSFVAIEKDGRMGLRRETSHESSPSRRPMSTEYDTESTSTAPPEDTGKASRKLFVNDSIPESPRSPVTEAKPPSETKNEEIQTPVAEPSKPSVPEESTTTESSAKLGKDEVSTKSEENPKVSAPAAKPKMEKSTRQADQTTSTAKKVEQPSAKRSTAPSKVAPKGATTTQTASTASRTAASSKRLETKPSSTTDRAGAATSRPKQTTTGAAAKKPTSLKINQEHNNGFVKPKPKSPTKPVSLPSSLMAPTASSVSKVAGARGTSSRQSAGGLQAPAPTQRSSSRASISTVDTATTRTVRRKPSTVNQSRPQSRPSIGPPPKKATQASAAPKKDAPVDEGFLARMMRPTQSSSSKTNDKTPATPPKRSGAQRAASASESGSRRGSNTKVKTKVSDPFTERTQTPNPTDDASNAPDETAATEPKAIREDVAPPAAAEEPEKVSTDHADDASAPLDIKPDASSDIPELTEKFEKQSLLNSEHEVQDESSTLQDETEVVQADDASKPSIVTGNAVAEETVEQPHDLEVAETTELENSKVEQPTAPDAVGDAQSSGEPETAAPAEITTLDKTLLQDTLTAEEAKQDDVTQTSVEPSTTALVNNEPTSEPSLPIQHADATSKIDNMESEIDQGRVERGAETLEETLDEPVKAVDEPMKASDEPVKALDAEQALDAEKALDESVKAVDEPEKA